MNDLLDRLRDDSWKNRRYAFPATELQVWHDTCLKAAREIERLQNDVECYEGMKEGFATRLADVERERDEALKLVQQLMDENLELNRRREDLAEWIAQDTDKGATS